MPQRRPSLVMAAALAMPGATTAGDTRTATPATPAAAELSASLAPPTSVGAWSLSGEARRIEPAGIFDYMDGGGELYVGYRFDHVDVYEYATKTMGEDGILVEIYSFKSPNDAYGVLSQDWAGESVRLAPDWPVDQRRALYGSGLLRTWTGDVFVRVLASLETPASREAVLSLGRVVVAGRPLSPVPTLLRAIPAQVGGRLRARLDRHVYLRSHLVLNSVYFLATANVLDLGPEVEAVTMPYDDADAPGQVHRAQLVLVRYPSGAAARDALVHLRRAYLAGATATDRGTFRVEDGWSGWRLDGRGLAVCFGAAAERAVMALLDAVDAGALDGNGGSPP
jgi:hypothetical protein